MNKTAITVLLPLITGAVASNLVYADPTNTDNAGQNNTQAQAAGGQQQLPEMKDKIKVNPTDKKAMQGRIQLFFDRLINGDLDGVKALSTGKLADDLLLVDSVRFKKAYIKQKKKYGRFVVKKIQVLKLDKGVFFTRVLVIPQKVQGMGYYRFNLTKVEGKWKVTSFSAEGSKKKANSPAAQAAAKN